MYAFARAVLRAALALVNREVEDERQVGHEAARGERDQLGDEFGGEAAARALVGGGGVGVAVGEDDVAGVERGADERADVLRAVGGVEQEFGERVNLLFGVEQDFAQARAQRRAPRLARRDDLVPAQAQFAGEHAQLRGLAAPVYALEGDESGGQSFFGSPCSDAVKWSGRQPSARPGCSPESGAWSPACGPRCSPAGRRACWMVEMACLKMSCSCAPDSSSTENLSKLRMRPDSFAPFIR